MTPDQIKKAENFRKLKTAWQNTVNPPRNEDHARFSAQAQLELLKRLYGAKKSR